MNERRSLNYWRRMTMRRTEEQITQLRGQGIQIFSPSVESFLSTMYSRTYSSNPRHFLLTCLLALITLAIAQGLMQYATDGRVAYTMDSLSYRDAALNFIAGRPMQSTNVLALSSEHQPFLLWPPGYPALWASAILDLFEHSFFAFSMVLRANLEIPIIIAVLYVFVTALRRYGIRWLLGSEIWLPILWLMGYVFLLLYARTIRAGVPMDLRMLAVAFPFLLLALVPTINAAFSERSIKLQKPLVILLLGLLVNSGCFEAYATHENYASAGVPRWRSIFAFGFRDLRNTSPTSHVLLESIGLVQPTSLILTDYRARYIRYLTSARVYQPANDKDCSRWSDETTERLLLIGSPELPAWAIDCLKISAKWQLLRPSGRASPSIDAG